MLYGSFFYLLELAHDVALQQQALDLDRAQWIQGCFFKKINPQERQHSKHLARISVKVLLTAIVEHSPDDCEYFLALLGRLPTIRHKCHSDVLE
jgi:hypothetical protein